MSYENTELPQKTPNEPDVSPTMKVEHFEARRYFVSSSSGKPPYLVDMEHADEPRQKPKPACDCWPFKKSKVECQHIKAVVQFESRPDYSMNDFEVMP